MLLGRGALPLGQYVVKAMIDCKCLLVLLDQVALSPKVKVLGQDGKGNALIDHHQLPLGQGARI